MPLYKRFEYNPPNIPIPDAVIPLRGGVLSVPRASLTDDEKQSAVRWRRFILALAIIIGAAIVRSALATRLDSFTIDEAYHTAAGTFA